MRTKSSEAALAARLNATVCGAIATIVVEAMMTENRTLLIQKSVEAPQSFSVNDTWNLRKDCSNIVNLTSRDHGDTLPIC